MLAAWLCRRDERIRGAVVPRGGMNRAPWIGHTGGHCVAVQLFSAVRGSGSYLAIENGKRRPVPRQRVVHSL
ncbi:hypothetical protein EV378_4439 [Pseudonocardia endophytica]|uniref:Uncharacterized protein n=1 Tax=Pseudonocardia endophytica TaxID=401976 RepID=A0A4R1HJP2_PSEEN|nr:hypothetical protein EV378_4439 [Pseudonocardia endophytica]